MFREVPDFDSFLRITSREFSGKNKANGVEMVRGLGYYKMCGKARKLSRKDFDSGLEARIKAFNEFAKKHAGSPYGKAAAKAAELMKSGGFDDPFSTYFDKLAADHR